MFWSVLPLTWSLALKRCHTLRLATARTTAFYLAETLMVIDHQKKAPVFRPVCSPPAPGKTALNARLAYLI